MPAPERISLTYLSSTEIPKGSSVPLKTGASEGPLSLEVSELSGAVFQPDTNSPGRGILRAVGDKTKVAERNPIDGAKSDKPQNAIFDFKLELTGNKLSLEPISAIPIDVQNYRAKLEDFSGLKLPGKFIPDYAWDTEDMVQLSDGRTIVSMEGFDEKHKPGGEKFPRVGSGIAILDQAGKITSLLALPEEFQPTESINPDGTTKLVSGQRPNLGLEAAGLTEDGKTLFVGMESPLVQDGPLPNFKEGATTRILKFALETNGEFKLSPNQIKYKLEPIPTIEPAPVLEEKCDNGLVDILPLSSDRFLSMERATIFFEDGRVRNSVRIYDIELGENGTIKSKREAFNSKSLESQLEISPAPVGKAQPGKLPPGGQRSENFEGLEFGPLTEKGERTVLIVGDDNARDNQRTLVVALKLEGK